jgi:hypothetical protein
MALFHCRELFEGERIYSSEKCEITLGCLETFLLLSADEGVRLRCRCICGNLISG